MANPNLDPPKYVDRKGVKLAYWSYGNGPRTLVLIMGVNMRAAHWGSHFLSALAERYRVLCFDNRGTGQSTRPVDELTAELWASDAVAVMDAEQVPLAHVLGTSMGGRVAQQLIADHPERVDHLVLLSSALGGPKHVIGTREAMASFSPQPGKDLAQIRRDSMIAVTGPDFASRHPSRFKEILGLGEHKRTPFKVLMLQLGVAKTDVLDRLTAIQHPALILHGDSDNLVPMGNSEHIHRALPNSRYLVMPGVGHLPAWEAPEALLEHVQGFLPSND